MIIDETALGRYAFILDINDLTPFSGVRYYPFGEEAWYPHPKLLTIAESVPSAISLVSPMDEWLRLRTPAYRISVAEMKCHHQRVLNLSKYAIQAIMVQLPEALAPLFRIFWYDGPI